MNPAEETGTWFRVATLGELEEDGKLGVRVAGREVALFLVKGRIFAFDDACPHADVPLSDMGAVVAGRLICLAHGADFDLETGETCSPLADDPLESYEARIVGDTVEVRVPATS
jgi:3-phenylpropionate/trans-cinnamate dioxygenase ferredoxin component